jgi:hypothetical protein
LEKNAIIGAFFFNETSLRLYLIRSADRPDSLSIRHISRNLLNSQIVQSLLAKGFNSPSRRVVPHLPIFDKERK